MGRKKIASKVESKPANTSITQYIRKSKGEAYGVMAAYSDADYFSIGFSLVNKVAGDRFNKERGVKQAVVRAQRNLERAKRFTEFDVVVPPSILDSVLHFSNRAEKYFKNKKKSYARIVAQTDSTRPLTAKETEDLKAIFKPYDADGLARLIKDKNIKVPDTVLNIIERQKNLITK